MFMWEAAGRKCAHRLKRASFEAFCEVLASFGLKRARFGLFCMNLECDRAHEDGASGRIVRARLGECVMGSRRL